MKDVQANLANGNLRARSNLTGGALLPLAGSLNLMADRLSRLGQGSNYGQRIMRALSDLSISFERHSTNTPFTIPESCRDLPEINRLLVALRVRGAPSMQQHNQSASGVPLSSNGSGPLPQRPPSPHPITQPLRPRIINGPYPQHESDPQWPAVDEQRRTPMRVVSNSEPLQSATNKRTD